MQQRKGAKENEDNNNMGVCDDNNTLDENRDLKRKNPVFRFNLSNEMVDALSDFSKMHQFDDRRAYTDAWNEWKNAPHISKLMADEIERLQNLDYRGSADSIENKIFKSGRYYFRNKSFVKVPPKPRGKYISVSKELICAMDEHILMGTTRTTRTTSTTSTTSRTTSDNNNDGKIPSPAELFNEFCKSCVDILKMEIDRLVDLEEFSENPTLIISKMKKTYKNRAFQILKLK